jgi:DNA helicase-2/ATP-dependent DNA helicase PcrA
MFNMSVGALPAAAQAHVKGFQQDLRRLTSLVDDHTPAELIGAVLDGSYPDYLRATYESSATRLEDIQQLAVFARSYRSLRSFLSELVLLGELYGQEVTADGSRDTERLVLSSIHQAKGLEWRIVFVIRMCEGSFPSDMALAQDSGEEEERRIFYVATTRAKDELYLTHPLMDLSPPACRAGGAGWRGNSQLLLQPSRFLQEIRFTLYEQGQIELSPRYDPGYD